MLTRKTKVVASVSLCLALAGSIALVGGYLASDPLPPPPATTKRALDVSAAPNSDALPAPPASAAAWLSDAPTSPSPEWIEGRRREVAAYVESKNKENAAARAEFARAGFRRTDSTPPRADVARVSPELLAGHEDILRRKLSTAPPGPAELSNVVQVAREAKDPATRFAAVEAIATMGEGDPQRALLALRSSLPEGDPARQILIPRVQPRGLSDPIAAELAAIIDASNATERERDQAAFTVALIGLRDGSALPKDVGLSREALARIERMQDTINRSDGPVHDHHRDTRAPAKGEN